MFMPPQDIARIREDVPADELRRLVRSRWPFRNSRGSFRGIRITPMDAARVANHESVREVLTPDAALALLLDEPDYIVFSLNAPLCWHSRTRGIQHRSKNRGNETREWVISELRLWPDKQTEKRYNRMVGIVRDLEE